MAETNPPTTEDVAKEVAEQVVNRIFLVLGINALNPDELVKLQKDFAHLRGWRESMEIVKSRGLMAATGFLVTGILGYVLYLLSRH